jgi:pimeloyl-ACP methyl ester carboxylesterase
VRAFLSEAPAVRRVVIFGLSEGAAAALLYAPGDPRVGGLILANPWIRMDGEVAKAHLRQNLSRVLEKSFWEKIRKSEEGYRGAARSFLALGKNWIDANRKKPPVQERNLKDRLMDCLDAFAGPIQIILSGGDPATAIFQEAAKERLAELSRQGRLTINIEPEANHVFSRGDWRAKMIGWSLDWTKDIC